MEWLWAAWQDLHTCRFIGMDIGVIPWTAVDAYAARMNLSAAEYEELWACVQHLEGIYREHLVKQRGNQERKSRRRNRR